MSLGRIPERVSEAWIKATGRSERPSAVEPGAVPRRFSVAISREAGTGGPAVARAVGARLSWQVYDHELLELVARDLHVRAKLLEDIDERHVTWLQECVEAFAAVPSVREGKYVRHLIETMLSLSAQGHCVLVGRGAPFVLPPASTLRVRLVAPFEDRVAAVMRAQNVSRHDAARFVEQTDRERSHFVRLHFVRDSADPQYYDLVVNASQFSVDECADMIVAALRQKSHGCDAPSAGSRVELALASA